MSVRLDWIRPESPPRHSLTLAIRADLDDRTRALGMLAKNLFGVTAHPDTDDHTAAHIVRAAIWRSHFNSLFKWRIHSGVNRR